MDAFFPESPSPNCLHEGDRPNALSARWEAGDLIMLRSRRPIGAGIFSPRSELPQRERFCPDGVVVLRGLVPRSSCSVHPASVSFADWPRLCYAELGVDDSPSAARTL